MDLETENRLTALLMEEARRLRQQADREGVHVYLRHPTIRGRPNSRFLTATVRGVQQANRAVEVDEMWRAREKERELDNRLVGASKDRVQSKGERCRYNSSKDAFSSNRVEGDIDAATLPSSSRTEYRDCSPLENGDLSDDEVEEFLHSRVKRGRGAVGSRINEPGPYLSHISDQEGQLLMNPDVRVQEEWERRVLGPEKPPSMKPRDVCGIPDTKGVKDTASSVKQRHSEQRRSHSKSKKKEKRSKRRPRN